jgi:hypothetical protein
MIGMHEPSAICQLVVKDANTPVTATKVIKTMETLSHNPYLAMKFISKAKGILNTEYR